MSSDWAGLKAHLWNEQRCRLEQCRHHAQAGAGPSAALVVFGGRLYGMAIDAFVNIVHGGKD